MKKYGHAERHMKLFHPTEDDDPLNCEDSEIKEEGEEEEEVCIFIISFKKILNIFKLIF